MDMFHFLAGWWLSLSRLKNMSSSVGMMTFPTEWKRNPNVPNHQPVSYVQFAKEQAPTNGSLRFPLSPAFIPRAAAETPP
jgi:hypothetical protein